MISLVPPTIILIVSIAFHSELSIITIFKRSDFLNQTATIDL